VTLTSKVRNDIIILRFDTKYKRHFWKIGATHTPVTSETTINRCEIRWSFRVRRTFSKRAPRNDPRSIDGRDKVRGKGNWRMVKMILTPLVRVRLVIYSGKLKHVNRLVDTFTGRSGIVDRLHLRLHLPFLVLLSRVH